MNKGTQRGEVNRLVLLCQDGLPRVGRSQNKPFGRVLPLEVQIKIMFWVECFYTMDKRKKVVQELKG